MSTDVINSESSLQRVLGDLREAYKAHRYIKLNYSAGTARSKDQNAISHAWYAQLARELREDDESGWKVYCKLHFGVPILRRDDEEFRGAYDSSIKLLKYEQKLEAMKFFPVTSLMTKPQLSEYLEAMQRHFWELNVKLEFPKE